ncbi:glutathione S-transferase 1-like isoform X2 [Cherax quadricarinatus]|nr:glutathione S-transferase 1-like isoform X2 [Cherax quadricarinatus]
MPLDLYYTSSCAHCRSVMLTAKALELELNLKRVDLCMKEQLQPDFLELNPQHCVPTLVDDGFVLWDSRAICTYLVSKYGKDDSLCPKELRTRAMLDRLLYFDIDKLVQRFGKYVYPVLFEGQEPDKDQLPCIDEALGCLDQFLTGQIGAVSPKITIADHILVATVSTIEAVGIDFTRHKNLCNWLRKCKSNIPGYTEINEPGAREAGEIFKEKLASKETEVDKA